MKLKEEMLEAKKKYMVKQRVAKGLMLFTGITTLIYMLGTS